jgi:hypothetical protein
MGRPQGQNDIGHPLRQRIGGVVLVTFGRNSPQGLDQTDIAFGVADDISSKTTYLYFFRHLSSPKNEAYQATPCFNM